jgi:hypothetical protein
MEQFIETNYSKHRNHGKGKNKITDKLNHFQLK